jgi:DNA-nicking Smr family endonuclease
VDATGKPSDPVDVVRLPVEEMLDLHAFAPREIPSVVDEYITAAHARGFAIVRLIHGRGRGVQRAIVQRQLDRHPFVAEFWDAPDAHLGATVARLHTGPIDAVSNAPDDRSPS